MSDNNGSSQNRSPTRWNLMLIFFLVVMGCNKENNQPHFGIAGNRRKSIDWDSVDDLP